MLSWLFGNGSRDGGTLVLRPNSSAIGMPGFPTSSDLRLVAGPGDTVGDCMERFNTYRGPDHQITQLFTEAGGQLLFTEKVCGNLVAIVR
jgi:hypothetical protein